jgi:NADPH:quinone reductase-like Zn-dependent oxidoreductase
MKAILQNRYGRPDDLAYAEAPMPALAEGQVLVRVRAASMHADVWHMVMGRPYLLRLFGAGLLKPKNPIPGTDMAGIVEKVGGKATRFKVGDAVFGETMILNEWNNGGAFAEYVAVSEAVLALKPERLSFEEAASVPTSGIIALRSLTHEGGLRAGAGQRVLINGAGGALGSFAVQIAKAYGAEVTAVDVEEKADFLKALGADQVISARQLDVSGIDGRFDIIQDIYSNLDLKLWRSKLARDGKFVYIGHDHYGKDVSALWGVVPHAIGLMLGALFDKRLPKPSFSTQRGPLLGTLADMLGQGKIRPHIGAVFPLSEARTALERLVGGQVCGKIVLKV